MKKWLVSLLVLALMVSTVCPAAFAAPEEIEILCWMSEQETGITAQIDAFNESQNEIEAVVSYMTGNAFSDSLSISLPAGSAPDIISMNVPYDIDFSGKGYIMDISDMFEDGTIDLSKYPQSAITAHTINGVLHGVPRDYDSIAMFYNKALFDAKGLPYPTDGMPWDEFVQLAVQLTDTNAGIYGTDVAFATNTSVLNYIFSAGGSTFDETGHCAINSDIAKGVLQKLSDVINVYGASPTIDQQTELSGANRFMNGTEAMHSDGSWNYEIFYEALGDNLGVCILPSMGETPCSMSNSLIWAITTSTKNPEAARKVLAYLASYEAQAMTAVSVIPAYEGTDEMWVANYEGTGAQIFIDNIRLGYARPLQYSKVSANEINTMIKSAFSEVLTTGDVSLLDAHVEKINAIIDGAE